MLKIIAIASEDGWAFVDRDGEVLLIKPQYSQSNLLATSRVSAGKAIYKYRFEAMDESFPDWAALLEFLRRRLSERHSKEDVAPPGEFAPEILEDAPKELKAKLLAWIGKELIPNREWKAAIVLLKALQKSTGTMDEPELRESVLRMLNDCAEGMLGCDLDRWELSQEVDVAKQFPVLADAQDPDAVKKLAQEVAEKHQVFEVGAAA